MWAFTVAVREVAKLEASVRKATNVTIKVVLTHIDQENTSLKIFGDGNVWRQHTPLPSSLASCIREFDTMFTVPTHVS